MNDSEAIKQLNRNIQSIVDEIDSKNKLKTTLEAYKYNPECTVCVENNRSTIDELRRVTSELNQLQLKLNELNSRLLAITKDISQNKILHDEFLDVQNTQQRIELLTREFDTKTAALELVESKIVNINIQLHTINSNIQILEDHVDLILYNKSIDDKIDAFRIKINECKSDIRKIESTLKEVTGKHIHATARKKELLKQLNEVETIEYDYECYKYYLEAVGRNGIPYDLIQRAIPQIETEINNILSQLVEFNITLEVDEKNISGKLVYDYDRMWRLENSSGMERFISSLAIRMALLNASNLPKPNCLIVDEGFGVLDKEHLNSMQILFNMLKTQFDFIFIVSHLEITRDMVDHVIEIHKEDGYSQISI